MSQAGQARIMTDVSPDATAGGRVLLAAFLAISITPASAHDVERTQVSLTFARDGSFILDVSNDPAWLELRLERFRGDFRDRVVIFVDGREIRPASVEFLRDDAPGATGARATYRMRGRMPLEARTLRWYYGLVADPYPLIVRRADGRVLVHEIAGDAWSAPIDIGGQFGVPFLTERATAIVLVAAIAVPLLLRGATRRHHPTAHSPRGGGPGRRHELL